MKAGHAGTLDPDACGVLPIMVGRATSLFDYIVQEEKVYVAEIAFGTATDTQDAAGQVIESSDNYPSLSDLQGILPAFTGNIMQRPPAYSAIKQGGKRLYALARQGIPAQAEPRPIHVNAIDVLGQTQRRGYLLRVFCGKGTYIRTLCHDIGQSLGCPAHMRILIRERSGPFHIEAGITMEALEQSAGKGIASVSWLLSAADVLGHLPRLTTPEQLWKACINGVALTIEDMTCAAQLPDKALVTVYCRDTLVGLYEREGKFLRLRVMLLEPQRFQGPEQRIP